MNPNHQSGLHQHKGDQKMKCSIQGCPGEYEQRKIVHTVRYKGKVIVIDHVPAEVCSVCGDVLLRPETVRQIEALLRKRERPISTVPLYEYA
jgi:YgiT-type zinc finger domain-containing protein